MPLDPADFDPLLRALRRLRGLDPRVGGGWGIDVLAGRLTRPHHDVDLFVPVARLGEAAARWRDAGAETVLEEPGRRVVLRHHLDRLVDLGGLAYGADGHAVRVDADGDLELFASWGWTRRRVGGADVVCLSAEAQRLKHRRHGPTPQDAADLAAIAWIDDPPCFDPTVRPMAPPEAGLIQRIETASDRLLEPLGYWPLPPSTPEAAAAEAGRTLTTLVAGHPAVGFSRIERLDGQAHLGQLSVLAEYGRMGVGRGLVEATAAWARQEGYRRLTLTTFADVPFNAPWYRRLGFVELLAPYGPELARAVEDERPLALLGPRVVMARSLG